MWRPARCLLTLIDEVDRIHPDRPRAADGLIGDVRHQATVSDHNPIPDPNDPSGPGVVTAWDITTADFTIPLAAKLRSMAKAGDGRIKYVIYRGQICSARDGWAWRPYSGFSQHFDHIHLSVSADPAQYDRTDPWHIFTAPTVKPTPAPEDDDMTPEQKQELVDAVVDKLLHGGPGGTALVATHADMVTLLRGTRDGKHPFNLTAIAEKLGIKG